MNSESPDNLPDSIQMDKKYKKNPTARQRQLWEFMRQNNHLYKEHNFRDAHRKIMNMYKEKYGDNFLKSKSRCATTHKSRDDCLSDKECKWVTPTYRQRKNKEGIVMPHPIKAFCRTKTQFKRNKRRKSSGS